VPPAKAVSIWLGVDVMAEYSLEEATEMLDTTLSKCVKNLEVNHEEWSKIKDCKTTLEVNLARCYNYAVDERRSKQAESS
jgi:prefoldin subunit 5